MAWTTIIFERQKLFDEVWDTPVSRLAKAYEISDVGLRKICVSLDIPIPPRGYWAKLAAGQKNRKPTLHSTPGQTTYVHKKYKPTTDEFLDSRVAEARVLSPAPVLENQTLQFQAPYPHELHRQTMLILKAMKTVKIQDGAYSIHGVTWADISVSEGLKERTFMIIDIFARALENLDGKFDNSQTAPSPLPRGVRRNTSVKRNGFSLHGQEFFLRIREKITQELIPPPVVKPTQKPHRATSPSWTFQPPEYRYIPTGKLEVAILDASSYYERYKISDSPKGTIEDKTRGMLQSLEEAALRRKVEIEIRAERELERKKNAKAWENDKANKDKQLAKLTAFEKLASQLDRARSLRRFIDEIRKSPSAPSELTEHLELMQLMANWLDPLVKAPWPDVDTIGETNPYGSTW